MLITNFLSPKTLHSPPGLYGGGGSGQKFGFKADFENSYLLKYKS